MSRLLPLLFIFICFLAACSKDKDYNKALVIDTGNISVNGCGYLLRLEDGTDRKPDYLPSAFQHDSLKVLVKYHDTGNPSSCNPQSSLSVVSIDDIKRDL